MPLPAPTSSVVLTAPPDANPAGNVHGGVIMQKIDSVGWISAVKHAKVPLTSASVSHIDFLFPVHVGAILTIKAVPVFSSRRSIFVLVNVFAEGWAKGKSAAKRDRDGHAKDKGNDEKDNNNELSKEGDEEDLSKSIKGSGWTITGPVLTNQAIYVYAAVSPDDVIPEVSIDGALPEISDSSFDHVRGMSALFSSSASGEVRRAEARKMWEDARGMYMHSKSRRGLGSPSGSFSLSSPRREQITNGTEDDTKVLLSQDPSDNKSDGDDSNKEPQPESALVAAAKIANSIDTFTIPSQFLDDSKASTLSHLTLPMDTATANYAGKSDSVVCGGVILKLIDNACGISAFRHARSNVVTASIEETDLLRPVRVGELLVARALPVFTSSRSIEILCIVTSERFLDNDAAADDEGKIVEGGSRNALSAQRLIARATTVFISLGPRGEVLPVAQVERPEEGSQARSWFDAGAARYQARKAARAAAKKK